MDMASIGLLTETLTKASSKIIKSKAMVYMLKPIKTLFKVILYKFIMIEWWLLLLTIICPILLVVLSIILIQKFACT
jgi:hypothetical protein